MVKLSLWELLYECPDCDSTEVYADNFEVEGDQAWREVECLECGRIWNEIFEFVFNEEVEDERSISN